MSHRYLTRDGYILNKKYLTKQQLQKIRKDLTVTPKVLAAFREFARPKPYRVYLESPDKIYLPRYYGIKKFGEPLNSSIKKGKDIRIRHKISLRPHQEVAAKALKAKFEKGEGGVLSLPCGYGKTVLAIWGIAELGKKTLVVVNKEFLMDQWLDSIEKFSNARTGIIQQDKIQIEGNDIVVAMLHSLCLKDYPAGIFDEFDLVIFDETHHLASEMFSKALPKVATRIMLGLSATPERKDGLSRVFYHYIGDLFHSEKRSGTNTVIVKQIEIMSSSPYFQDLFLSNGTKNTTGMISQVAEFPERNRLLIFLLGLLIQQGRTILVLSSRREHLEGLYRDLQQANFRKPDGNFATFGLYYGKQGMNKKTYKKMLEESAKCDIVLGTCQLAQEGLDIPTLNTLLFATPMTDIIQAVGRILRKYHKKVNPMVIDLVDKFGNFSKHAGQRRKFYKDEGYVLERDKIMLYDTPAQNQYEAQLRTFIDQIPQMPTKIGVPTPKGPAAATATANATAGTSGDDDSDDDTFNPLKDLPRGCVLNNPNGVIVAPATPVPKKIPVKISLRAKPSVPLRKISTIPEPNPSRLRVGSYTASNTSKLRVGQGQGQSKSTGQGPGQSKTNNTRPVPNKVRASRRFF